MAESENLVLMLLREIRADLAIKKELADVKSELRSSIAEVRSEVKEPLIN